MIGIYTPDQLEYFVLSSFDMIGSDLLSKMDNQTILDIVYDSVEILYNQNKMNILDKIINEFNLEYIGADKFTIITILSATYSYKDLLPKRKDFYNKIKNLHTDDKEFLLTIKDLE